MNVFGLWFTALLLIWALIEVAEVAHAKTIGQRVFHVTFGIGCGLYAWYRWRHA